MKADHLIIDNGSGMIKCGLTSSDLPTSVFPNMVGVERFATVLQESSAETIFCGHEAQTRRGALSLKYPVSHGIIEDWESMEKIWDHMYSNELRTDPSLHSVILTEAPLNPKNNRERMIHLFFELFNVPRFYVGVQAVLSLYAAGNTTGVVFDSGDGVTHIVPVYDGYGLSHAIMRLNVAGRNVTEYLSRILSDRGVYLKSSSEMESVRKMKEELCYVALDYDKEIENASRNHGLTKTFVLPDGQEIHLGTERFQAPEALFQPNLIGFDFHGVSQATEEAIRKCDLDIRRPLYENIIMSGGTTLYHGIENRLKYDLKKNAPSTARIQVRADPQRMYSVWIGGKILSLLQSFEEQWITMEEFQEYGPNVVHRKCF
jgi:actin-related protein